MNTCTTSDDFTSEIELAQTIFWTHLDFKLKSCSQKEQNRRRDPENSETHKVVHHRSLQCNKFNTDMVSIKENQAFPILVIKCPWKCKAACSL